MIVIELPWPHPALSPNSRAKWERIKALRRARNDATVLAVQSGAKSIDLTGQSLALAIDAHAPDKRRRDLDNILASLKPSIDGIAAALGIDDAQITSVTVTAREPLKPRGCVRLTLQAIA